ncbi:hypothetical protein BJ170DRAFT_40743 [Xylariales sp. AK1849]|nr:hypothetical protein BJ170DRAFT_40743 [Xylariales sp. AK1849]
MVLIRPLWFLPIWCNFVLGISPHHLHLPAVVSGHDGKAAFECWEISRPFSKYPTVGTSITGLADVSNMTYVVLPPKSKEGLHKPPHPMFFVLISGMAHVTLPESEDELWIKEGANGLIIAADVEGDGHFTEYPLDKASIALQIPFADGIVPEHRVVKGDLCVGFPLFSVNKYHDTSAHAHQVPIL